MTNEAGHDYEDQSDEDEEIDEGLQIWASKPYDHGENVEHMYKEITREIARVGAPWVPPDILDCPIPDYAGDEAMFTVFNPQVFRKPLSHFVFSITNRSRREVPEPSPLYSDYLLATYEKIENPQWYKRLATSVFPQLVAALDANRGYLSDNQVNEEDTDKIHESDERKPAEQILRSVSRIWGANFWSDSLCRSAFGPSAADVVKRLKNEVAEARLYRGGALIISSYEEPTADEVRALDGRLRPLLVA
jgi:hypothetical protein